MKVQKTVTRCIQRWKLMPALLLAVFGIAACSSPSHAAPPLGMNGNVQWVNMTNDGGFYAVGSGTYTEDGNGWPSTDFAWNIFDERRNMPWSGPDQDGVNRNIAGDYKVSFNGEATIVDNSGYGTTFTVTNQNYNSGSNLTTCDVNIQPNHWLVIMEFTNSMRTSTSATNTGITNLKVIPPGYGTNTTQVFTNECLDSFGPSFATDRTMGLSDTNGYPIWQGTNMFTINFSDRVKVGDAYQGGTKAENVAGHAGLGVAWEYLVQLCNLTNENLWMNVPINATDAYATNLADLLKYGSNGVTPYTSTQSNPVWAPLNSNLHVYLEYSNEVWNFSFTQSIYNENKATADGVSNQDEYVKRSYQIVQDFQQVYGTTNTILRPVVCWQEGNMYPIQEALNWLQTTYSISASNYFYGIGQAPYFNYTDDSSVNSILSTFWTGGDSERPQFMQWQSLASFYRAQQIGYESGPSYGVGVDMTAVRNANMASVVQHFYDTDFFAVGGNNVNYFAGGFGGAGPCGGTWTQGEDWNSQDSPKNQGLINILGAAAPAATSGALLPWLSSQTTTIDANDDEQVAPSGATYYSLQSWQLGSQFYLLNVPSSASYKITLYGNQASGNTTSLWVDSTDLGACNMPTTNGNSPTLTTGTLAAGQHGLWTDYAGSGNSNPSTITITLNSGGGTGAAPTTPDWPVATPGSGQVALRWYSSPLATAYNVERSTNYNGPYATISSPAATLYPSYTDTAAANNTTFYYVIAAVGANGTSPVSQTVAATSASAAPGVPSGLAISSSATSGSICGSGNGLINMSWTAVTGAIKYNVEMSTTGSSYASFLTTSATSFFAPNLTVGDTYYFEVNSINSAGSSAYSSAVSTIPTGHTPGAPTGLTAVATQDGVSLKWTPPALMDPAFSPDQYNVYRSTTSGSGYAKIITTSVDNLIDRGLTDGTAYYYVVTANNPTGESADSGQASATPNGGGTIDINAGGSASSPWVADVDYSGGTTNSTAAGINTGLISDPAPAAVYQSNRMAASGSNLVYTVTGLVANAPYIVRLHFCEIATGTTRGQRVFDVQVNGLQYLTDYDIVGRTGAVDTACVERLNTTSNSSGDLVITFISVTGLAEVSGIEVGYVGTGGSISTSPPSAPTGLTAAAGNAQVVLAWTGSSGATSYNVYRGTTSGGESATAIATGITTTGYTNTGLTNGTTYYYEVKALNGSGTSGYSNEAHATPTAGAGVLLASEPFAEATGALNGANGGTGWSAAWVEQNGHTVVPGYNIINTSPLTYSGLSTSGNYAVGGYAYETSGRSFDLTTGGNFGSNGYLSGGVIGASGKSLWISALMREDTSTVDSFSFDINDDAINWAGTPLVSFGYFGTASQTGGKQYWSLKVGSTVYQTTTQITAGTTALAVVEITFGSTNTINLYLNPTSLGGSAPGTTTLTETTASSLAFQSLAWYAGYNPGMSSFDELRFGTTYSVVTP